MKIFVHIGLEACGADRIQATLDAKRAQLADKGVLYPQSPGRKNHTRAYMAVTDPGHVDTLRLNRGFASPEKQAKLLAEVARDLAGEVDRAQPQVMILSANQFASMPNESELSRLRTLLAPLSDDIRIVAHLDEQARVLLRHYEHAVEAGRTASLEQELALVDQADWFTAALPGWAPVSPMTNGFPEIQAAPHWLDYARLQARWEAVFGEGSVDFRGYDADLFGSEALIDEIRAAFGIEANIGKADKARRGHRPASAEALARGREVNALLVRLSEKGRFIPRQMWKRILGEVSVEGEPVDAGNLNAISTRFKKGNEALVKAHAGLNADALKPARKKGSYAEPPFTRGFRATQYVAAYLPSIESATRQFHEARAKAVEKKKAADAGRDTTGALTPVAEKLFNDRAKENFDNLRTGRFAPHNKIGRVNEEELAAAYAEMPVRTLPAGNSGNVIVGCMKNEAPYILEWVAYHRMIGVDNFLIYTNGCEDGTSELLDRLQELGILQHRNNDDWKGNSPQQYALNKSLKEPVIENAEWVIHIDVDEFINIRCGNGMLADFFDRVPEATNVAMTWRLFGHNGVTRFEDKLVLEQFDTAAPKFAPKPHTTWGFKTMTKNIGAYGKLSCHRPNKLREEARDDVLWVNGSGQPMGESYKDNGWRSDMGTIGYDLLQLNHYALRSAESFLIKRQRGRALHVDRSIGINYWVRMDWGGNKDVTIKRNIPRVQAELARLLEDEKLAEIHRAGVAWHRAKADELHGMEEFQELYARALETKLTEMERVAFALTLDMEQ